MDGHSKSDCDTASAAGRCRDLVFSSDRYCELLLQTSGTTNRCTARRRGIRRFAVLLPEKETKLVVAVRVDLARNPRIRLPSQDVDFANPAAIVPMAIAPAPIVNAHCANEPTAIPILNFG